MRPGLRTSGPALLILVAGVAALHAASYWGFVADDALIAYRYAYRLAQGRGLTWNDDERVEGYTDLLWVLGVAGLHAVGLTPILAGAVLGTLGSVLGVTAASLDPRTLRPDPARVLTGGLFVALSGPVAVWAVGGLEATLLGGVLALGLVLLAGEGGLARWAAAVLLGAVALIRADGLVLVLGALIGAGVAGARARRLGPALAVPVALLALQLAFRWSYYDALLPNTAASKLGLRPLEGLAWAARGALAHAFLLGAAAVGLRKPADVAAPLGAAVAWTAWVVLVGGDFFPGWRHLVPLVPALAIVASSGARHLPGRWFALLPAAALLHGVVGLVDPEDRRARTERWEWDGNEAGAALLRVADGARPLLAVETAGSLPYFTGLPALDMWGLNDRWLALHPPPDAAARQLGHGLGDAEYYLRRRPDLFVLRNALGDVRFTGLEAHEMETTPVFRREYVPVALDLPSGKRARWIVRREGRLGVRREPGRVEVPVFLLATTPTTAKFEGDRLVAVLHDGTARLDGLPLPAGTWAVRTDPPLETGVRCAGDRHADVARVVALDAPSIVRVAVRGPPGTVLRSLVLTDAAGASPDLVCPHGDDEPLVIPAVLVDGAPIRFGTGGLTVLLDAPTDVRGVDARVDGADRVDVDATSDRIVLEAHGAGPFVLRGLAIDGTVDPRP